MNRYRATFRFGPPGARTLTFTFMTDAWVRLVAWDELNRRNNKEMSSPAIVLVSVEQVQ